MGFLGSRAGRDRPARGAAPRNALAGGREAAKRAVFQTSVRQCAVNRPGAVTSRAAPAPQAEERDCGHELEVWSGASKGKRSGGAARGRGLDRQKDAARGAAQHRKKDLDKEDITSIPGAPTAKERLQVGTQFSRCVDG